MLPAISKFFGMSIIHIFRIPNGNPDNIQNRNKSNLSAFLHYDRLDENERNLYRQGMAVFGGIAPTYHIELLDKPTIVWEFHSLLLGIQMMFSFMLTDDNSTLKVCKHCGSAFVATRSNMEFCSPQCKNQYNVYKSRAKKKEED